MLDAVAPVLVLAAGVDATLARLAALTDPADALTDPAHVRD